MLDGFLSTSVVCEADGAAYIVDNRGGNPCIFRYSIENGTTEFVARVERMDPFAPKMTFVTAVYYKGKIYFVPKFLHGISYIFIYEVKTKQIRYQEIKDKSFAPFCGYESMHRIENTLWLFPADIRNDVSVLSLDTMELSHVGTWSEAARGVQEKLGRQVKSGDAILKDGVIYTPLADSDAIMAMSLQDGTIHVYWLGHDARLTFPIVYDGTAFWIARRRNEGLLRWTPQGGVTAEIDISNYTNNQSEKYHGWFQKMYCADGMLWLLPKNDQVLLRINADTGEMTRIPFGTGGGKSDLANRQYWVVEANGTLHIYPFYGSWWVEVVLHRDGIFKPPKWLPMPKEWEDSQAVREMYMGTWKRRGYILDDSLPEFLEFVKKFDPTSYAASEPGVEQ